MMNLIWVPAVIALVMKLGVIGSTMTRAWAGAKWFALVGSLAALNFAEIIIHSELGYELISLKAYYVFCVLSLVYAYGYVIDPARKRQGVFFTAVSAMGLALAVGVVFSNLIIVGVAPDSVPSAATKGHLAWAFQLFGVVVVFLTMATLFLNRKRSDDRHEKLAYTYTIYAFVPLAISIVGILGLMLMGIKANGSMIIPLATSLFLIICAKGKNSYLIEKDIRTLNPYSRESAVARQLSFAQAQVAINNLDLKRSLTMVEYALIQYKLDQNQGNISETARQLGISRASLHRKLKSFGND